MRRPDMLRQPVAPRVGTAGIAALPGSDMPSASTMLAIVEAVPIVMQWPFRAVHAGLGIGEVSSCVISPARTIFGHLPDAGAGADLACRGSGR